MYACDIFSKYGSYNTWMNKQILDACEAIPDEKRKEDLGAFFGSIHDTLIHILVSDKHRMHQFDPNNVYWPGKNAKGDFSDWAVLVAERKACDVEMARWLPSRKVCSPSQPFAFSWTCVQIRSSSGSGHSKRPSVAGRSASGLPRGNPICGPPRFSVGPLPR